MDSVNTASKRPYSTQTTATVEHDVGVWKKHLLNCEYALRRKVAALMEAEKDQ
jgi:hypothetical protein